MGRACRRNVEIRHIVSYGAFVDMGPGQANGLVHISQLALERIEDPEDHFTVGQKIDVQVWHSV